MTTISILSGDWEIAFDDETVGSGAIAGLKMVRRQSGASSTVRATNALYSAIAEAADDFQAMGFENPMLPVTPNAYTMENNYFIPRRDIQYLKEGAISADWTVTSGEGVYKKAWVGGTGPVDSDIGRQIIEAGSSDSGTLLDFEIDPDGTTTYVWIRPDTSGDTFATTGALSCTADGGTMVSTSSVAALTGETTYSAIQAIGAVPTATEVYLVQDRFKMTSYDNSFQWWATDPTLALGIISILVRVKDVDTLIADGDVEVFSRRYTSLYDNFRLNVGAGGFSALPLSSAADINNTTGYSTETVTTASGDLVVGEIINEAVSLAKGVVTSVSGTAPNLTIQYYLVGDQTDLFSSGAQTVTGATSLETFTSVAPTDTTNGPTDTVTSGAGGTVTLALGGFQSDRDGDGNNEPYSIQFDCQGPSNAVPIARVYEFLKYITRRGATADIISGMNVSGETYRGLDGIIEYETPTGTLTEGDDVLSTTSGSSWTARILHQNTTNSPTYITVTDQQTSIDSVLDTHVIEDEAGGDDVTAVTTSIGIATIASVKSSPFGSFTGSDIFGARGIDFTNQHSDDTQAYKLTDDLGILNNPPNTVSLVVNTSAVLDRILVARDAGGGSPTGVIDKDQFGGMTATSQSDNTITVAGSIDTEVPTAGFLRVVETTLQQEHRYVYDSRTTGASGVFTLRVVDVGSAITTGGTSTTLLIDSTAGFDTVPKATVGMLVRNTFGGKTTHVWEVVSVDSDIQLTVRPLYGPLDATQDWDTSDTYEINECIQAYTTSDNIFDLIVDLEIISGNSTSNSFVKTLASDFYVVGNVRQGKIIIPFTSNQLVGDGGAIITVVRTTDTIAI